MDVNVRPRLDGAASKAEWQHKALHVTRSAAVRQPALAGVNATVISVVALLILNASVLLAATEDRPANPGGGLCGALVMYYICSRRKEKEIGGWLLYYYIQLYVGTLVSLALTAVSRENYLPSSWAEAEPGRYFWFLLSTVPSVVLLPVQLIAAEALRITRRPALRQVLITVLAIDLVMALVGLAIDLAYFPDNIPFDVFAVVWPCLWLPYFVFSKRVRRVFVTKDWLPPAATATSVDQQS